MIECAYLNKTEAMLSHAVGCLRLSKAARIFIVQNCRPTAGQTVPHFLVPCMFY